MNLLHDPYHGARSMGIIPFLKNMINFPDGGFGQMLAVCGGEEKDQGRCIAGNSFCHMHDWLS